MEEGEVDPGTLDSLGLERLVGSPISFFCFVPKLTNSWQRTTIPAPPSMTLALSLPFSLPTKRQRSTSLI